MSSMPRRSSDLEDQVLKRITSSPWDSSLPFTVQEWQETLFEAPETELPEGAPCLDKGSQIHQVLERCCGELNSSSETNMCFEGIFYFKAFVVCAVIQNEEFNQDFMGLVLLIFSLHFIFNKCSAQQNSCFNGSKSFMALCISTRSIV